MIRLCESACLDLHQERKREFARSSRPALIAAHVLFCSHTFRTVTDPNSQAMAAQAERAQRMAWLNALPRTARRAQRVAAVCVCASGVLLMAQMALIANLIEQVLVQRQPVAELMGPLLALAVVVLMRSALGAVMQTAGGAVADAARLALRTRLYRVVQARGPLWLRGQRSGELTELLVSHTDALEGYYAGYQPVRIEVVVVPLLMAAVLLWVDWVVAVILVCTAPLVPVFMMLVGWGAEAAGRKQLQLMARLSAHFADRLKGLGLLRVYGRGPDELAGVARAADGVQAGTMRVLRVAFLSSTVLEFLASVSVAMVALYFGLSHLGLLHIRAHTPSLGVAMFCLLMAPEFYGPLRRLAAHYHDRANALAAAADVSRVLGELPGESAADPQGLELPAPQSADVVLALQQVSLRPQGAANDVLSHFSLILARGEWLALVGPSGSGKSTVLEAAANWLAPREGELQWAGGLRVAHAGQRPYLFHGSIADNLRMAKPNASEAQLMAAAEAAQVLRFALQLPEGLNTVVGERGFGLSGGEARRIGLARALLQDADVLLLDEPTAFLDPQTEAALLAALRTHLGGRSLIMATHSEAAMQCADRVLRVQAPQTQAPQPDDLATRLEATP